MRTVNVMGCDAHDFIETCCGTSLTFHALCADKVKVSGETSSKFVKVIALVICDPIRAISGSGAWTNQKVFRSAGRAKTSNVRDNTPARVDRSLIASKPKGRYTAR